MTRRAALLTGLALWLAVCLPFALLVAARWAPLLEVDRGVVGALQPVAADTPAYRMLLDVVTTAGTSWFRLLVLAPVVVWLLRTARRRLALFTVLTAVLVGPLVSGLKLLVGRQRPEFDTPVYLSDSLSYPSGHAAGIVTLVGVLLVVLLRLQPGRRRLGTVLAAAGLVLLVGLTRVALGAHYPSDVLGGFAFGAGWVLVLSAAFDVLPERQEQPEGAISLHEQQSPEGAP